jgi:hypothetical protein
MLIHTQHGNVPQPGDAANPTVDGPSAPVKTDGQDAVASSNTATTPAPGSPEFAALKAKRAEVKAAFEKLRASDGAWGKSEAASLGPKSKLTANPYAPSANTLHRVATQVDAGPVLPPPHAHVKAISGAAAKAMAQRLNLPSHATTLGAAAAGLGVAAPSAAMISAALMDPHGQSKEAFTPEEAAQIKNLVGRAPPTDSLATSSTQATSSAAAHEAGRPRTDATGTAQLSDSYDSLQHRATTFVPWQAFCISLAAKEMKALGEWLMLRQKVQHLAALVAVQTRKLDVQHEQFNIAMEQAEKFRAFGQAFVTMQAMQNSGTKNRLINEGFHADPDTLDLSTSVKQDSNTAAVQDLSRMALIRQAAGEKETLTPPNTPPSTPPGTRPSTPPNTLDDKTIETHATAPFNGYAQLAASAPPTNGKILLKAPANDPTKPDILVPRTLLTATEFRDLDDKAKPAYTQAFQEMNNQRRKDLPGMAALYDHEAGMCAAAAKRCLTLSNDAAISPDVRKQRLDEHHQWNERANYFKQEGMAHHTTLQTFAQAALRDENAFGDVTRARRDWEGRRNAIATKLNDKDAKLTPTERLFYERKKLNFDLRASYLDKELGKYTNPKADNRLSRWHTGAPSMADGYTQALLVLSEQSAPGAAPTRVQQDAKLSLATMNAIAPKGAEACNTLHFKVIDAYRKTGQAPKLTAEDEAQLQTISRVQILRHLTDREQALAQTPGSPNGSAHQVFLHDEAKHLAQAKTFWQTRLQHQEKNPGTNPISKLAFNVKRAVAPLHAEGSNPANIKTPDIDGVRGQTPAKGTEVADYLDAAATANHFDQMAKAGGNIMGNTNDPKGHAYQNFMFERLNVLSQAANNTDFSIMGNSATGAASGAAPEVAEEASQALAETYGLMAQERNTIQPMVEQLLSQAYQV